jgi:2-oxo-4-hydroxy-4-carboxy-5-ureidoimidazoline decarboxylase
VELAELNALEEREFTDLLGAVFEHSPWVAQRTWRKRPFASLDDLHESMMATVRDAAGAEQLRLVRAHPELAGSAATQGSLSADSSSEQGRLGFTRLSPDEFATMAELNRAYRERHGFPCIVALRLHATRESVMAEMRRRIANDSDAELENALKQISHITRGRLDKWVS